VKLASDVPCEQGADDQGSEGGWEEESGFHGSFAVERSLEPGWGHPAPMVYSSEIAHQGVGDDVSSTRQIIPNDQAQHLGTLSGLVEMADVPISGMGAVGVNDGDGEGGRFGQVHRGRLN
jgi:hypothetical protein